MDKLIQVLMFCLPQMSWCFRFQIQWEVWWKKINST